MPADMLIRTHVLAHMHTQQNNVGAFMSFYDVFMHDWIKNYACMLRTVYRIIVLCHVDSSRVSGQIPIQTIHEMRAFSHGIKARASLHLA